jgi:hypothetical protein
MSVFSYNVSFSEKEVVALKDALEFYVSEEAMLKLSKGVNKGIPYHFHTIKELLEKLKNYENAHFSSSTFDDANLRFLDEALNGFTRDEKVQVLEDIRQHLVEIKSLDDFDGADNLQIIMSPSFQKKIIDALILLAPSNTRFVKEIFSDSDNLISFTKMFVNFYRFSER